MLSGGNFLGVMKPLLLQIKEKVKFIGEICFIYSSCSLYMCLDPYYILLATWDFSCLSFYFFYFPSYRKGPLKKICYIDLYLVLYVSMDEHKASVSVQCCPLLNEHNSLLPYYIFITLGFEVCIDDEGIFLNIWEMFFTRFFKKYHYTLIGEKNLNIKYWHSYLWKNHLL